MARKEINIFGTSFLDLLSGALAAVIILFIIVPKMTSSDEVVLEKIQEIRAITADLDDAIERIKDSVPKDVYDQIEENLKKLSDKIKTLDKKIEELEVQLKQLASENEELKHQLSEIKDENVQLKQQLEQLKQQLHENEQNNSTANTIEKTLGVFAKFGILCRWNEAETDVDLGVQSFNTPESQVWRMHPSKPWGILGEDVRERTSDTEERFELFYVPEINPGEYTAWVNVYNGSRGSTANVSCILIFHPNESDEVRQEIPTFSISKGVNKCFVTFRLTNNGFTIISHREPIWGTGVVTK